MAADVTFFVDDQCHLSKADVVFSASSTQNGYAVDNAREADLQRAWKPNDSAVDEWLKADLGTTAKIGAALATAYAVLAYDSRTAGQSQFVLQSDNNDDGNFSAVADLATWNISGANALDVNNHYMPFAIPATAKRYYRVIQKVAQRTGTATAKIYNFALYNFTPGAGIFSVVAAQPGMSDTKYKIIQEDRVAAILTAAGVPATNSYASPGFRFDVNLAKVSDAVWVALRDAFFSIAGSKRAIYVQKTGLRNPAQPNFFMCRLSKSQRDSGVEYRDTYDTGFEFVSESWI